VERSNLVWQAWRPDGRYRLAPSGALYPCATAAAARVLCRYAATNDDQRLRQTLLHLLETQYGDGGWRCSKFPVWARAGDTVLQPGCHALGAGCLSLHGPRDKNPALDRGVDSLLDHWWSDARSDPVTSASALSSCRWSSRSCDTTSSTYVYVLSCYDRARRDLRYLEALRVLESKLDARGRVVVERPNRRLAGLSFCAAGRPSVLATARYARILENLGR